MSYSLIYKGIKYTLEPIGNSTSYNVFIDDKPISNSSRMIYLDERKQYKLIGINIVPGDDFNYHQFVGISAAHENMMFPTEFPLRNTVLNRLKSQVGQGRAGKKKIKKIKKRFNKLNKEDILVEAEKQQQQINHLLSISTLVATIVGNDSWKDNNSIWKSFIEKNIGKVEVHSSQTGSVRKRKVKKSKKLRRKRISKKRNSRKRRYRRK
jgi:hypothetical protein